MAGAVPGRAAPELQPEQEKKAAGLRTGAVRPWTLHARGTHLEPCAGCSPPPATGGVEKGKCWRRRALACPPCQNQGLQPRGGEWGGAGKVEFWSRRAGPRAGASATGDRKRLQRAG